MEESETYVQVIDSAIDNSSTQFDQNHANLTKVHVVESECELYGDTLFVFLVSGIGTTLVCLLGIFGNILSAVVLSRHSMKSSVNIILFALSIFDLLFVTISLIFYGISGVLQYFCVLMTFNNYFVPLTAPWLFPLIYVGKQAKPQTHCIEYPRFNCSFPLLFFFAFTARGNQPNWVQCG